MDQNKARYRSLSSWLKGLFGEPVRKIALDAGLGCPNRDGSVGSGGCIYCNPRGSGTGAGARGISISAQVDAGIEFLSRRFGARKFIGYFQSFTNTYAAPGRLADLYRQALDRPEMVGLAVGTRPDCVPDEVLDILGEVARSHLVWVEYGMQSVHARTLRLINRGHGPEAFFDAAYRTNKRGILTVAHVILGLPGESLEDMVTTARALAAADVHGVKIHPLYIIRQTALETLYRSGDYRPLTENEAAEATLAFMAALPEHLVVHRMTSDPHPEELVAPLWMLDRQGVRKRLDELMVERNFRQGSNAAEDVPNVKDGGNDHKGEATRI